MAPPLYSLVGVKGVRSSLGPLIRVLIQLAEFCPLPCHLPWPYVPVPFPLILISPQWGLACNPGSHPLILPRSSTSVAKLTAQGWAAVTPLGINFTKVPRVTGSHRPSLSHPRSLQKIMNSCLLGMVAHALSILRRPRQMDHKFEASIS